MRILTILSCLLALGAAAGAQTFICHGEIAVLPLIRSNGQAESVGEPIIVCTGTPPVGRVNLTISLAAHATSRSFNPASVANEALLLVDEPGSGIAGTPPTQIPCGLTAMLALSCAPDTNVYQGAYNSSGQITFLGVAMPPPISVGGLSVIFRVTNLRVDATALPPSTFVQANISFAGPVSVPIDTPTLQVAVVSPTASMTSSLLMPDLVTPVPASGLPLSQCVAVNRALSLDPTSPLAPDGVGFVVRLKENFATAFKNYAVPSFPPADVNTRPPAAAQNIPSTVYNMETAFFNPVFPATDNLVLSGLATQGTRVMVRFTGPPAGIQVHAPVYENGGSLLNSRLRLVAAASDGSSPSYTPLGPLSPLNTYYTPSMTYVYEVTAKTPVNPFAIDTIDLPFYIANPGAPYVGLGLTQVNVTMAPVSTDISPTNIIAPRFAATSVSVPVADLSACAGVPMLKAVILSKAGVSGGVRTWTVGLNNYGTAPATNATVTNLSLVQTAGAACTPVVLGPLPVNLGTVGVGATVPDNVSIDFTGCAATARFKATIFFTADLGISGNNVYANQFQ